MGEADHTPLTLEEFEREWISAHDALDVLAPVLRRDIAAERLISRVKAGLFQAVAKHYMYAEFGKEPERATLIAVHPTFLAPDLLGMDQPFWTLGDFTFYGSAVNGLNIGAELRFFGVRFDPEGIRDMLPTNRVFRVSPMEAAAEADDPADTRRPPSNTALIKWRDLFMEAYGTTYNLGMAWSSAKGMFPNHKVTRKSVEELIPARPPGRPKNSPQSTG